MHLRRSQLRSRIPTKVAFLIDVCDNTERDFDKFKSQPLLTKQSAFRSSISSQG